MINNINTVNNNAREALSLMRRHKIPVIPEYYTVWYNYVGNTSSDLKSAVDKLLQENIPLDDKQNWILYNSYCRECKKEEVENLKTEILKIIRAIMGEVKKITAHSGEYGELIEQSSQKLSSDNLSIKDVRSLVYDLLDETKKMGGLGKHIKEKLDDTTKELEIIKKNFEKVKTDATIDFLTGLSNRMSFDKKIQSFMIKARENDTPLSLLMIDIDHFKRFNDTFGHLVGDEVLKFVAESINKQVRGGDFTARFGGEEFAVLLPFTISEGAQAVGENIRRFFSKTRLKSSKGRQDLGKITVSIGGATMKNNESASDFIERADNALYFAKNNGRNMVAIDQIYNR